MKTANVIKWFFLLWFVLAGQRQTLAEEKKPKQPLSDEKPVRVQLVASVVQVGLGEEFQLGVRFEIAPGWHIYGVYSGNTGKPTLVKFESDERHTKVLEPQFPYPEVFDADDLSSLSFGYSKSVLVFANAMVFEPPEANTTQLLAKVSWLACKKSCVNGRAELELSLPVRDQARSSLLANRFVETAKRVPRALGADQAWLAALEYENGLLSLSFRLSKDLGVPKTYIPSWVPRASCKIVSYQIEDQQLSYLIQLKLRGINCLPGAGGIVLFENNARTQAVSFSARPESNPAAQITATADSVGSAADQNNTDSDTILADHSFWLMLLFAFLGGLLLNVMPCVIPVVIPKLLHVVRTAQKTSDAKLRRRLLWSNSLAYTAGVIVTLLSLAILVILLKMLGHEVGWGFQFQNPWFLVFMISLLLVLGLGMLHVYPLKSAEHSQDLKQLRKTRRKSPLLESFFTGLLVTFLGTPCTAPMLGPALGYAFTASSIEIVIFLTTVGLGLATPFLLLGAWTGWTRVLPTKVTERYDRIMRGMAFLLFGTAVWLIGVLSNAYGGQAALNVIWFCLALSTGAWVFGLVADETHRFRVRLVRLLPIVVCVGLFGAWILPLDSGQRQVNKITWQPFSEKLVRDLRRSGKTVFIDFTAEWCMNCKANERLVIDTQTTRNLLQQMDIATVKADYTRANPIIQRWLKRFGRAGVPLYLVFGACQPDSQVIVLPEILTAKRLHQALEQARSSRQGC